MNRTIKLSLLALAAVFTLWACGGGADKNMDPGAAAEKFLKAMKSGNWSTAKAQATEETKKAVDKASKDFAVGMQVKGDPNDIEIIDFKEEGDQAVVNYTDGGSAMKLTMKKVDGAWLAQWSKDGMDMLKGFGKTMEKGLETIKDGAKGLDNIFKDLGGDKTDGEGDGHDGHDHDHGDGDDHGHEH